MAGENHKNTIVIIGRKSQRSALLNWIVKNWAYQIDSNCIWHLGHLWQPLRHDGSPTGDKKFHGKVFAQLWWGPGFHLSIGKQEKSRRRAEMSFISYRSILKQWSYWICLFTYLFSEVGSDNIVRPALKPWPQRILLPLPAEKLRFLTAPKLWVRFARVLTGGGKLALTEIFF